MRRPLKILNIALWTLVLLGTAGLIAIHIAMRPPAPKPPELENYFATPSFSLTDQDGHTFISDQLRGQPWIADFVYTSCPTECPILSSRMAMLQGKLPDRIKLVSFSVDPANDTPPVLRTYAAHYGAKSGRWIFLTGTLSDMTTVIGSMKVHYVPAQGKNPLVHDTHFLLIDATGQVRGIYDLDIRGESDRLIKEAGQL